MKEVTGGRLKGQEPFYGRGDSKQGGARPDVRDGSYSGSSQRVCLGKMWLYGVFFPS